MCEVTPRHQWSEYLLSTVIIYIQIFYYYFYWPNISLFYCLLPCHCWHVTSTIHSLLCVGSVRPSSQQSWDKPCVCQHLVKETRQSLFIGPPVLPSPVSSVQSTFILFDLAQSNHQTIKMIKSFLKDRRTSMDVGSGLIELWSSGKNRQGMVIKRPLL